MRQHFASILNDVLTTSLFLLLVVVTQGYLPPSVLVDNITFYLALVAVVRFTVLTILWWIERIVITDKRVMLAQGFFVHKIAMMPLTKVTDLTFERSIRGRLLGYGTLIVESAGQIQALNHIDYIPRPEEVYEACPSSCSAIRARPAPPVYWRGRAGGADGLAHAAGSSPPGRGHPIWKWQASCAARRGCVEPACLALTLHIVWTVRSGRGRRVDGVRG